MCRWMAWHGQPVLVENLLFKTRHSLIDQSLHSRMGAETTNGDGFGMGWYGTGEGPAVYRSIQPAWGDANLRHLAGHIESPLFLAHVRATTGTAIQQTNCHPFTHRGWLFVHNGVVNEFARIRRDMMLAIDPAMFAAVEGSTDSEVLFYVALTLGLENDPVAAMEKTIGLAEASLRAHGIEPAIQASIGISDGRSLWAIRYSTEGKSRTLFESADVDAVQHLYPDNVRLKEMREGDRLIVSEPLADLPGVWHEFPEATALHIAPDGEHDQRSFRPHVEEAAAVTASPH
jgi:predicted glutamine amidotransferase